MKHDFRNQINPIHHQTLSKLLLPYTRTPSMPGVTWNIWQRLQAFGPETV